MSIRVYHRQKTGSPQYVADKTRPSNKNDGDAIKNRSPEGPPAGAAHLDGSGPRIYVRYMRDGSKDRQVRMLSNQAKSEGADIPRPRYDRRAS